MPKRVSLKGVARRWFAKLWVKEYPRLVWFLDWIDVACCFLLLFLGFGSFLFSATGYHEMSEMRKIKSIATNAVHNSR